MKAQSVVIRVLVADWAVGSYHGEIVLCKLLATLGVPQQPGRYRLAIRPSARGRLVVAGVSEGEWPWPSQDYFRIRIVGRRAVRDAVVCRRVAERLWDAAPGDRFNITVTRCPRKRRER